MTPLPNTIAPMPEPVCLRPVLRYAPLDPKVGTLDRQRLLHPGFTMSAWQLIFGNGITAVESNIEQAIVRADHALTVGSTNEAKHIVIELNLTETVRHWGRGVHFVVSLADLWFTVEYAQLRMATAEKRAALLHSLILANADKEQKLKN